MNTHEFKQLLVVHRLKDAAGHGMDPLTIRQLAKRGLLVETCLRQVCIMMDATDDDWLANQSQLNSAINAPTNIMRGRDAYHFLLQTVTGLNSSIPGETNVLGQFRCAWKRWRKDASVKQLRGLNAVMHQLFNDSKWVRHNHLQNTGGASYGSLVRKLLQPKTGAHILFVGAGKFAQRMLPLFAAWETALWNHRLHKGLQNNPGALIFSPNDAEKAGRWASHLVMTTPADAFNDRLWLELARTSNICHVVHLGQRRADPGIWQLRPATMTFNNLDDVFELRQQQSLLRDLHVHRARNACKRIAYNSLNHKLLPLTTLAQST
jgi:hypothetical protein